MHRFILSILLGAVFCGAATINVATTGSDITGSGSVGAPYLTIPKAFNNAVAGDTVLVANGTYSPSYGTEYTSTSTTSLTIGTGTKTLTVATGKAYSGLLAFVRVYETSAPGNYMQGNFTSYNSGTGSLVMNVANSTFLQGSGTHTDWTVVPGNFTLGDVNSGNDGYSAIQTFFSCPGTIGSPITIKAANHWGAILDGGLPNGYFSFGTAGGGTDGVLAADTAFDFETTCTGIIIQGFVIQNFYWLGANMNTHTLDHIQFLQNHFTNIGRRTSCSPSTSSNCSSGGTGTSNGIVGVFAGRTPTGVVVTSNITWDRNQFDNIGRIACTPTPCTQDFSHDHGLYIYDGPYTITNNIFYGMNAGWNIQFAPGSHDNYVVGNTFIGGANPTKNGCLMIWADSTSDGDGPMSITNLTLNNNIMNSCVNFGSDSFSDNTLTVKNLIYQFNLINNSSAVNTGAWCTPNGTTCSYTISNNILNSNPLFVNGTSHDYHIQAGSPAINAGTTVVDPFDFDGNPRPYNGFYDDGAFEFTSASTGVTKGKAQIKGKATLK